MRKTTLIFITAFLVVLLSFHFSEVHTNTVQPPSARTGAPGEQTCGISTCHNNIPNTGGGGVVIAFTGEDNKYIPGSNYVIKVTVTDAAQLRFGFEMTSLDSTDSKAGSFSEISDSTDVSFPFSTNGRLYVAHHNANTPNTFIFSWTAPLTDVGDVTFYAAGNAANADGHSTGDHIYTTSLTISSDNSSSVMDLATNPISLEQNLVANRLNIQFGLIQPAQAVIHLFNIHGELVKKINGEHLVSGTHSYSVEIGDVPSGIYFVRIQTGNLFLTEKIIVQKTLNF